MGVVRRMPERLVALVRAGEVVERPASCLKELVENAIDAGATRIDIQSMDGGRTALRVNDNGCGMDAADAALALERHATSKLTDPAQLHTLTTLGYRGEGLGAIAAVARVHLETQRDGEAVGTAVRAVAGRISPPELVVRTRGTAVRVEGLFESVPARRAFLESPVTERNRMLRVVRDAALAHPAIAFRYEDGDRLLADYPATADAAARLAAVYPEFHARAMPIACTQSGVAVTGFCSRPALAARQARHTTFLVNGRPIEDPALRRVIAQVMGPRLLPGQLAEAVLWITVAPDDVDVNVHPTKARVRFRREGAVYAAVHRAVEQAIADPLRTAGVASAPGTTAAWAIGAMATWSPIAAPGAVMDDGQLDDAVPMPSTSDPALPLWPTDRVAALPPSTSTWRLPPNPPVLFQVARTFLVAPLPEGVLYVDQHSASERVAYRRLRAAVDAGAHQPLLIPDPIPLAGDAVLELETLVPALARAGFVVAPSGPGTYWLEAVPAWVGSRSPARALADAMHALTAQPQALRTDPDAVVRDAVLKRLACHSAIRAGDTLTEPQMRALWLALTEEDLALHDVHGRAGAVLIPHEEIARRIGRHSLPG